MDAPKFGLVIIDMQQFFYDEKPDIFSQKLVPNTKRALTIARESGIPVVHVITRHSRDKSDWPDVRKRYDRIWCMEGTKEIAVVDGLKPLPSEHTVIKKRYSGFYETNLDDVLKQEGIQSIIVAGYAIDVCVRMTIFDAYNRGYHIHILSDCVEGWREDTEAALDHVRVLSHSWLTTTLDLPALLQSPSR